MRFSELFYKRLGALPCLAFILIAFMVGAAPAILNLTIDPYQVFSTHVRPTQINDIAEKKHYPLWKLAKYRRGQHDTIILGDSRARSLRDKYWHELGMDKALNLAYGGGTIPEIHSTFELVKKDTAIRNLVIGIQLRSFDEDHKKGMNRVPEAVELLRNRMEYLKNWTIAQTAWDVLEAENQETIDSLSALKPSLVDNAKASDLGRVGRTPLNRLLEPEICFGCELPKNLASVIRLRRDFFHHRLRRFGYGHSAWMNTLTVIEWRKLESLYALETETSVLPEKHARQVLKNGKADWRGFEFSEKYWSHIKSISDWATANNINLLFVIPPTITEMQRTIQDNGLGKLNHQFRVELAKLGTVIDLDFDNRLTRTTDHFSDAYHFNSKVARMIVGELVGYLSDDKQGLARVAKRRKLINCQVMEKDVQPRNITETVMLYGQINCRSWRQRS